MILKYMPKKHKAYGSCIDQQLKSHLNTKSLDTVLYFFETMSICILLSSKWFKGSQLVHFAHRLRCTVTLKSNFIILKEWKFLD